MIGGGAAGFFAAIAFAETAPGSRVAILEKGAEVLGKVKISGGGRCNVTHACFEPIPFTKHYPRGEKNLIGPLHHWGATETVEWFRRRSVELKTESDGRMFPTTDRSETIIAALREAAREHGIDVLTKHEVETVLSIRGKFHVECVNGSACTSDNVLLATGGVRSKTGAEIARSLGHSVIPAAPSLFTFKIDDSRIDGLSGLSVGDVSVEVVGSKLASRGPLLITHWGLSGPAILKLSAWGARELQDRDYRFEIVVDFLPDVSPDQADRDLLEARETIPKKQVRSGLPGFPVPSRLWRRLAERSGIAEETTWSNLPKSGRRALADQLSRARFQVDGKSMNKDEFVTAGGIDLREVDFRTMQSRIVPGLFFAGEILDIDGITGGFNFQSAWTTGRIAGESAACAEAEE